MQICVFGAGAIGCHLAARLANAGYEPTVVGRGAKLSTIKADGITVRSNGETIHAKVDIVTSEEAERQPYDIVFTTIKANAIPLAAASLARLTGPGGVIAFVVNGVPWWWNHGWNDQGALTRLDPSGELWKTLRHRALGVTLTSANTITSSGHVEHTGPNDWIIGEPAGEHSERLQRVVALLHRSNISVKASNEIREDVWRKLLINAAFNPLGALTYLYGSEISTDEGLRTLATSLMREAYCVGRALGLSLEGVDIEQLARGAGRAVGRPSSMLQDVLLGRRLEVEPILGQVLAFAEGTMVQTPSLGLIYEMLRGRDMSLAARGRLI